MSPTPAELVRAHARAHSLLALRRVLADPRADTSALRSLSASVVERACLDPAFRTWAAGVTLGDGTPDPQTALRMIGSARATTNGANVLPVTKSLQRIVGPHLERAIVADAAAVNAAWMTAERMLDQLRLGRLASVVQAVDLIAGLYGPRGEIRALSNPRFPGFAAIGVNNPPLILAEQTAHEAVHVTLAARIALDASLKPLTDERVGVLSPFTGSVRTIERVVHGILSYAAVRQLWRAVATEAEPELWMELSDRGKASELVARRLRTLNARLTLAMTCLFDAAGPEVCDLLNELASDFLAAELDPRPEALPSAAKLLLPQDILSRSPVSAPSSGRSLTLPCGATRFHGLLFLSPIYRRTASPSSRVPLSLLQVGSSDPFPTHESANSVIYPARQCMCWTRICKARSTFTSTATLHSPGRPHFSIEKIRPASC